MKNIILIILLFLFFRFDLASQSFEISGGANRNILYDLQKNEGHFSAKYFYRVGFDLGIAIDDVYIDTMPFRFTVKLINYKSSLFTTDGMLGGESTTKASINNYKIGFGLFPLNLFFLSRRLQINFGGELGVLIHDKIQGYKSSWSYDTVGIYHQYISLDDGSIEINKKFSFGFSSRLAYEIKVKNDLSIVPQYSLYIGLNDEFKNIEAHPASFLQYLEIGIKKRLE